METTTPAATDDGATRLTWTVPASHPAFAGHFPGQPLLPGASLLADVLEAVLARPALAARLGPAPTLTQAKFLAPVLPGSTLTLRLGPAVAGRLPFEVRCGGRLAASGQFGADLPGEARPAP